MIKIGDKLYSILKLKCPHCHKGEFYEKRNPYNLRSMSEVKERCVHCNRRLSMEPGFYYGAMYVSYALGVAHIVCFLVAKWLLDFEMTFWNFIILVGSFLVILTPLYYSISKIVWANLFMSFKENNNEKS